MRNCILYVRVSTITQNNHSQLVVLRERAGKLNFNIVGEIEEKISGRTKMSEREGIVELKKTVKSNKIHTVFFSDVSRIGRNLAESRLLINELTEQGINCHIRDISLDTLNPDGHPSPFNDLIMNLLMSIYEYQRADIVAKVKIGKANSNKKQGRKLGSTKADSQLLKENREVVTLIKSGLSIRSAANLAGKSPTTVQKIKRILAVA